MTKGTSYKLQGFKLVLVIFLCIALLLPLFSMFSNMLNTDIGRVITSSQFIKASKNSLVVSIISTILSVSLGGLLAWCLAKTTIKYKSVFSVLFTLPMLIPSISHGMGFVILLGANGVITNLFNLNFNIYGMHGIVLGSIMYSFPVAFLMIYDILQYEDHSPYEAANVLGISKTHQFISITWPYLRKPLIAVIFSVFTMIITDYGVPIMIGGNYTTLPVLMYQEVIGLLDFGKGSVIGIFLMIPAVIAFLLDIINKDKANVTYTIVKSNLKKSNLKNTLAYVINIFAIIFVFAPIATFIILSVFKKYPIDLTLTIDNVFQTFRLSGVKYLINSLLIALFVSTIGTILAYFSAYLTARVNDRLSKVVHLVLITTIAVPGIVLGLSYATFFNSTCMYGTMVILVLVNIIHFFASPYLLAYNSFSKINANLEDVGSTLGITRTRMLKDVFIPQMTGTLLEMFSYFFVNSIITISAVSFLTTVHTMPMSLMITQFEAQMLIECSAFVSVILLTVNLFMKALIYTIKKKIATKQG